VLRKGYYSPKRRAIMMQGDDIDHLVVFERDEWICHICNKLIDRFLRGDAWMRATLDHVVPLALGGTHTWDNVAAAHWFCNMQKGCSITK
jgi:5-methylcytosine-specific restriction endonuclease McrA